MQQPFDFDHFCRLAHADPAAFEAQRRVLFEEALAEMPLQHQAGARARLAEAQVRMAGAKDPAGRLAAALSAMSESLSELQRGVTALCGELAPAAAPGRGDAACVRTVQRNQ